MPRMYNDYVTRIADTLQKTLAFAVSEDPGIRSRPLQLALPPMPPVSAPPAEPLRLAVGQPLLVRSEGKTQQITGVVQLGVVREGRHVALTLRRRRRALLRFVRAGGAALVAHR